MRQSERWTLEDVRSVPWHKIKTGDSQPFKLLLWTAISFVFLAVNNFFLLADTTLFNDIDLSFFRFAGALTGVAVLIVGLVWEAE